MGHLSGEVARRDQPDLQSALRERRTLLVLRDVTESERVEERAQVGLDGLHAEHQLLGDLSVRCRDGELTLAVRAAERNEHAPLCVRDLWARPRRGQRRADRGIRGRAAENDQRASDTDHGAVFQPRAAVDALAVDERAVGGTTVVDERPFRAEAFQRHVHARHLVVPFQHDAIAAAATDGQALRRAAEIEEALDAVAVTVEQKWTAAALGLEPRLDLGRGRLMEPERRPHQPTLPVTEPASRLLTAQRGSSVIAIASNRRASRSARAGG